MPDRETPISRGRVTSQMLFSGLVRPDEELHLANTMAFAKIIQEIRDGADLRVVLPSQESSEAEFAKKLIGSVATEMGRGLSTSIGGPNHILQLVQPTEFTHKGMSPFDLRQTSRYVKIAELNYEPHIDESALAKLVEAEASSQVDHLGKFVMALANVDEAQAVLDQSVLEARANGVTWAELGKLAGVSTQAAHQRWNARAKRLKNERQKKYNANDRHHDQSNE